MSCHAVARLALWGVGVLCVMCADLSEDFKRHNKMVSGFPCRLPQPRVFYLQELVSAGEWKAKYEAMVHLHQIKPKWTILHRCAASGCCDDDEKRCLPSSTADVSLAFANLTGKISFFQIPATNHTSCDCQSTDKSGKKNIK